MASSLDRLLGPEVVLEAEAGRATTVTITGLTADSRAVVPGMLFAALPGSKADGNAYIAQALAKGAAAVLVPHDAELPDVAVPTLRAADARAALAKMAVRFYGEHPATIVAVTGTSGKTSVVEFARQIFAANGLRSASLGTLGVVTASGGSSGALTTPDPITLAQSLSALAREGITHVALEASSHGLDQRRLDGVALTAGAFTNLGRDHLDYHPTIEAYLGAKLALFDRLLAPGKVAVVNTDGARWQDVAETARRRGLTVAHVGSNNPPGAPGIALREVSRDGFRQMLTLDVSGTEYRIVFPLPGAYQIENALTAAGLAIATGIGEMQAVGALEGLQGVPGRLEVVGHSRGGLAVVDYAHKPEALAACLDALRPFASGRLICVMGCGGDRDRGKRPLMGAIAVDKADVVIVTDDNPRTEYAAAIRYEILAAAPGAIEIGDRAAAISAGVGLLGSGDVLIVAGKGHETGQIVGGEVLPFSDVETVTAAIAQRRGA